MPTLLNTSLPGLVAECKEENTVIAIVVLTNTSVKEILEPAVLERTTPAV